MKRRDIVIGVMAVAALSGLYFWRQRAQKPPEEMKVPETLSIEDTIESKFNLQIPDDVERAELTDVSGGSASGLATRKFDAGVFDHSILADLPDPGEGKFYEGWLVKGVQGEVGFEVVSTGKMRIAKGGYLLEFSSKTDYSQFNEVVVTLEEKDDSTPEKHILEGSF